MSHNHHFTAETRAPLEMQPKTKTADVVCVCPYCRTARMVNKFTHGVVCSECDNYSNKDEWLDANEAKGHVSSDLIVSPEYMKFRADAEKEAYAWRDKQIAKQQGQA